MPLSGNSGERDICAPGRCQLAPCRSQNSEGEVWWCICCYQIYQGKGFKHYVARKCCYGLWRVVMNCSKDAKIHNRSYKKLECLLLYCGSVTWMDGEYPRCWAHRVNHVKALEAIRKLRIEKVQEARELKLKLDHLKTHKETAQRLSTEVDHSKEKSRQLKVQMEEVQQDIKVSWKKEILISKTNLLIKSKFAKCFFPRPEA